MNSQSTIMAHGYPKREKVVPALSCHTSRDCRPRMFLLTAPRCPQLRELATGWIFCKREIFSMQPQFRRYLEVDA